MKIKFILCLLSILFAFFGFSQSSTARFQGTIKAGTAANSVMIALKPNESFTGQISNLQFVIQVPNTVTPMPAITIKNNPLSAYVPTAGYVRDSSNEFGYYNYLFAVAPTSQPAYSFTANTEMDALEIQFIGGPLNITSEVRLAQLPGGGTMGGSPGQSNFFVEVGGVDNTNTTAMFYGTGVSNNAAGYDAYSYVPVPGISLPIKLTDFLVYKQSNNAVVTWKASNDDDVDHYELLRSTNGREFINISSINKGAGSGSKTYTYNDISLTALRSNIVYYRIRQVEKSGKLAYTDIRSLRLDLNGKVSIYPNPAKEGFYVMAAFENNTAGKVQLSLINAAGQLVERKEISAQQAGNYYFKTQSSSITSGTYMLKISKDNELIDSKQVVIKK